MSDIQHAHLYGMREAKYDWLSTHDVNSTDWNEIEPQKPFHLFIPQDNDLFSEFQTYWKITELMPINSVGILTARDNLTICWTKENIWQNVQDFASLESEEAREKYDLGKDTRDWKVFLAQDDLKKSGLSKTKIVKILYRPFDFRYTYYTGTSRGFHCMPRDEVMGNLTSYENLGIISARSNKSSRIDHFLCSSVVTEAKTGESSTQSCFFPLYIYPDKSSITTKRCPNFSDKFLTEITNKLGYTPTPEAIFYYIYAIFHSPTYRTRYAEFLKIDFPRVPLTTDNRLFRKLGEYGEELVALHLMKSSKLDQHLTQIIDKGGEFIVDAGHPKYTDGEVIINKKGDRFTGVPKSVWGCDQNLM
jgi:predicted helicase